MRVIMNDPTTKEMNNRKGKVNLLFLIYMIYHCNLILFNFSILYIEQQFASVLQSEIFPSEMFLNMYAILTLLLLKNMSFCLSPVSIIKDIFFSKSFVLFLNNQIFETNITQGLLTYDTWTFESSSNPSSSNVVLGIQTIDVGFDMQKQSFSIRPTTVSHTYLDVSVWTLSGISLVGQSLTIRCLFIDYQVATILYPQINNFFVIQQHTFKIVKTFLQTFSQPLYYSQIISFNPHGTTGLSGHNFKFSFFINTLVNIDTGFSYQLIMETMRASIYSNTAFKFELYRNYFNDIENLTIKFVIIDIDQINSFENFYIWTETISLSNNQTRVKNFISNQTLEFGQGYSINAFMGLQKIIGAQISFQTKWETNSSQQNINIATNINTPLVQFEFTFDYIQIFKNRCNKKNIHEYPYYYATTKKCYNKCPLSTYLDVQNFQCYDCTINNCLQCRNTSYCLRCQSPIFKVNPQDRSQCIRLCKDDACIRCHANDANYCLRCDSSLGKVSLNGICVPLCGDGIKDPAQECDDNNLIDGDGCNSSCKLQQNFQCYAVQQLNTQLFKSQCIFSKQVKMEVKLVKKIKFQNRVEIQLKIDNYWGQYQDLIQSSLMSSALQFGFAVDAKTLTFSVKPDSDNCYKGSLAIKYIESIQKLQTRIKFIPPLTNLSVFIFESPQNTMTVPPNIYIKSRANPSGNYSQQEFKQIQRYIKQFSPSSKFQLSMNSQNNNFMYLYSEQEYELAENVEILALVCSIFGYSIFLFGYFYGKTVSVDMILIMQSVFVLVSTTTKLSASYTGLVLQGPISFLGFSLGDKDLVIYQENIGNLKGLNLSLSISKNLNIMMAFILISILASFAIFIVRCFWKSRKNILTKIAKMMIGQISLYGLLSISVIGNFSTAMSIKTLAGNQTYTISSIDFCVLLLFNVFQFGYIIFLCKKLAFFGQFFRQLLKFKGNISIYTFIQISIILNSYLIIFSLKTFLQKYVSLFTCFTFLALSLFAYFKKPFIYKKANNRMSLSYFLGSFLCLGIYLQNELQHSVLYHYWPLVIVLILLIIQGYSVIFLFIFAKRGLQKLDTFKQNYNQLTKVQYRQFQNRQFQKRYFPNMYKQMNQSILNSQNEKVVVDNQFQWQNFLILENQRYKYQRNINIKNPINSYFQIDESQKVNKNNISNQKNDNFKVQSQNYPHVQNQNIFQALIQQAEGEKPQLVQQSKLILSKKELNDALKKFQNSQWKRPQQY